MQNTSNSTAFCETLRQLGRTIQNRRELLTHNVCLLYNNITPRISPLLFWKHSSGMFWTICRAVRVTHQAISTLSSPKKHLSRIRFDNDDELQRWSQDMVQNADTRLLWCGNPEGGFATLRLDGGDTYVEKWSYLLDMYSQCKFCKINIVYMLTPLLFGEHTLYTIKDTLNLAEYCRW